jgi:alpha-amylase
MKHHLPVALAFLVLAIASTSCQLNHKEEEKKASEAPARFERPQWISQSNIYEVNVRQYTPEGTFKAFAASLPRLKDMGVEILWFMPVTPISEKDRKGEAGRALGSYYAVADYRAINPEFGTIDDFKTLVKQAHEMGFKVIVDWVANHTGADHPWLTKHKDFYMLDSAGTPHFAFDWSDTRELNYDNKAMRDSMIESMKFWIRETDIDGFRCDVANEVPTDFWKDCIAQLRGMKTLFMLAEGDRPELYDAGFDATYFWPMFQSMKRVAAGATNALALDSVINHYDSTFKDSTALLYFTSNHDENSWNLSDYGTFPGAKHDPFAVFTHTMKNAIPLIYSGQEEPVLRRIAFFEKDSMEFKEFKRAKLYKTLLNLRKNNPALAIDASWKKISVGDDKALYAYLREKAGDKIFVILNLSGKEQKITIKDELVTGEPLNVFMGVKEKLSLNHSFNIQPWGYIVYDY